MLAFACIVFRLVVLLRHSWLALSTVNSLDAKFSVFCAVYAAFNCIVCYSVMKN